MPALGFDVPFAQLEATGQKLRELCREKDLEQEFGVRKVGKGKVGGELLTKWRKRARERIAQFPAKFYRKSESLGES